MTPQTIADIEPAGTATPLTTNQDAQATVVWITYSGSGTNGGRVGDKNVGSSRGVKLAAGVPFPLPRNDFEQGLWPLADIYVWSEGTDKFSVTWA